MSPLKFNRYAFGICIAVATLASCSGAQTAPVPSAGMSKSSFVVPGHRDGSWMAKGLRQRDLLYVASNGRVDVYRYWQRKHVGVLMDFSAPGGECADSAGNVYIVDLQLQKIYEYAHGGKTPINVIDDSPYTPYACSVARSSGNLAVANSGYPYYNSGNIVIYPHGSGMPIVLHGSGLHGDEFFGCAYDDRGNLLAMTQYNVSSLPHREFYYLPSHGTKLARVSLPRIRNILERAQGLAWDGKYWIVGPIGDSLYLYTIDRKAHYVGVIYLPTGHLQGPVAIYRKSFASRGTQMVGGTVDYNSQSSVEYWKYSTGGAPIGRVVEYSLGVTISLGTR
jgi:hypothetical protein